MSNPEFFSGADSGGESFDPASFEKFREKMKRASAQIKAIKKSEQKQKKTEDDLIKILVKFIKTGKKKDQLILVTRLIEMNVPAGFIVSLLLISNEYIQKELKVLLLPKSKKETEVLIKELGQKESKKIKTKNTETGIQKPYIDDNLIPLKVKIAITNWFNEITKRVNSQPHKILKTILTEKETIQLTVIQLATFCLRDFLEQNKVPSSYNKLKKFINLVLSDIVNKAKKDIENRPQLKSEN